MRRLRGFGTTIAVLTSFVSVFVFAQAAPPLNPTDLSQRAADAFAQNHFEDAAKLYRQAVKQRPQWAEGWGYLAASLFSLNRYTEARDAYLRTTVLTPKNGPSWAYAGFCEYELRDYPHAFDHLAKAEHLGLGDDVALASKLHYELGLLWDTAGQFEIGTKELAFFASTGDKSPPVIEATGLNVLHMPVFPYEIPAEKRDLITKAGEAGWEMNAHHLEDARKKFEELIAAYPKEPNLHYAYGFVLSVSDQEAAVAELEKELAINPVNVPAMIEAAFLSLEMGHLEKSAKLARRAIAIQPKNYAPHNILGRVLEQTGQAEQGIAELETAVKLAPSVAAAHFNLAQAYQKAGKNVAATREFAAFKELDQKQENHDAGAPANP